MTADTTLGIAGLPFGTLPRRSDRFGPPAAATYRIDVRPTVSAGYGGDIRIGFIRNGKARLNVGRYGLEVPHGGDRAMPDSLDELRDALALFARNGVNALVIDGGDGTIRDVLTVAAHCFERLPRVAVVPSGKTNALAIDLGIPHGWTADDAVRVLRAGHVVERTPIEVRRAGARLPEHQGFIFGAGNFVRATEMAQRTHRIGAFNGMAVGLSIAGCALQTVFGGADNIWRRGTPMRITLPDGRVDTTDKYLLLGSTLERMPLGILPFGPARPGLKLVTVDSPPKRLLANLPALLRGADFAPGNGYRRADADEVGLVVKGDFILDGEAFAGGALTLTRGAPIGFAVP